MLVLARITTIACSVEVQSWKIGLLTLEWVVVISTGHPPSVLAKVNSLIRRIDLSCKLLAPVLSGFIISFISMKASAVVLALWNIVLVWLQYWLFVSVYNGIPVLSKNSKLRRDKVAASVLPSEIVGPNVVEGQRSRYSQMVLDWRVRLVKQLSVIICWDSWVVYMKQEVTLPGVSLAFLYFTVLSFGTLMTATLDWKGIPAYLISLARGFSAIVGIGATLLYPVVHSWVSTLRTGLWSIWMQWFCLLVCVGSIWVSNNITSAWMLMTGVAASRLGLWMFDLAVMQLMQDNVSDSDRCVVGGVQNSLQSLFDLLTYIMGIIISDPKDFSKLIAISFFLVTCAALMYVLHVYRVRKHLFHLDKLFPKMNWIKFC